MGASYAMEPIVFICKNLTSEITVYRMHNSTIELCSKYGPDLKIVILLFNKLQVYDISLHFKSYKS
jgi:hypothetical protein